MAKEKKQFRQLSDEELKQVTGGASIDCSQPENRVLPICKDRGGNRSEIPLELITVSFDDGVIK